jgi:hypothetical protein
MLSCFFLHLVCRMKCELLNDAVLSEEIILVGFIICNCRRIYQQLCFCILSNFVSEWVVGCVTTLYQLMVAVA